MGKIVGKSIIAAGALVCLGLFLSTAALAAGLGRLTVLSALGEPLKAEIEIVSLQPGEGDSLSARLGSVDAFRQANIDLNGALLPLRFAIERRSPTQYVITMTSSQAMNEPFIDMLVELSWSSGKLVREYTFLLDPPEYKGPVVASVPAVVPPAVAAIVPPQPAAVAEPAAPAPERPATPLAKPAAVATAAPAPPKPGPAGTYAVKRGDTLAKIAQQNPVEGATLQQMLVALYRGNSDAFDGENMNRPRTGKILNLPDKAAIEGLTANDARRIVNSQSTEYAQYRRSLGAAVADTPVRPDTSRQASGQIGTPAQEKPAPAKEPAKDQLRLSRADDAKAGGKTGAAAAKDDSAAKDKAIKEANERVALLEKNLAEMKKLAELKSQAGAQLQQQAQAAKAAPAPAPAAKPEATKATPAAPAAAATATTDAAKADAAKAAPAAAVSDAAKSADAPKAAAPKAAPRPVAPPPPEPPSFLDELRENEMALGGAGAVVVLLAGYAGYAVRRRRKQAAEAAAAATSVIGIEPSMSSLMGAAIQGDTGSAALAGSAGATDSAAASGAEEIDPVAEADVYMAYGRDAQAEEILKDALAKDASHQPARLKLLEIYANRKDPASFESHARELHSITGGQGEDWDKVVALGLSIDPGNALYGGAAGAVALDADDTQIFEAAAAPAPDFVLDSAPEAAAAPALDFDLDGATAAAGSQPDIDLSADTVAAPQAEAGPAALDFDLDLGGDQPVEEPNFAQDQTLVMQADAAPAPDAGMSIDFELPSMGAESPASGAPAADELAAASAASIDFDIGLPGDVKAEESASSIDFDIGLPGDVKAEESASSIDFDLGTPAAPAEPESSPMLDLSSISLDLGGDTGASAAEPTAQWQEVATKLDLAKAYQDMGDKDGARELLNEVQQEGDATQKEQANTMLSALG